MTVFLQTHPESPRRLLRRGFTLYGFAWLHVFLLSLFLSITTFLPSLLSLLAGQDILVNLPLYSIEKGWLLLLNLTGIVFFVAILWRLHCLLIHKNDSFEDDLIVGIKKIPSIFAAWILQLALVSLSILIIFAFTYYVILNGNLNLLDITWRKYSAFFLVFLELAFVLFIFLSFYFFLALIVLENKGILSSLSKSFSLAWNHLWQTIYVQSIPWLTYLFVLVFLKFIVNLNINIFFVSQHLSQGILDMSVQILIFAFFIPWIAVTLIIQLKDLELRKLSTVALKPTP